MDVYVSLFCMSKTVDLRKQSHSALLADKSVLVHQHRGKRAIDLQKTKKVSR